MGSLLGRVLLLLACLIPVCPLRAAAGVSPRFTGTFIQLLGHHQQWTSDQWRALFSSLRAIGVNELVIQWTVNDQTPLYASRHFKKAPHDVLPRVMDVAREQDFRVLLGLVHDSAYWRKIARNPKLVRVYCKRLLRDNLAAARELADRFGSSPAFAGFYIPQEIDDRTWLPPEHLAVLEAYLTALRQGLRDIAPQAPVAISGFSNAFADPELLGRIWHTLLAQSGIDRVLFQDGIGVGKLGLDDAGIFLAAVAEAARQAGRAFTPIVETFTQVDGPPINTKPFRAEPASLNRLIRQLALADRSPHTGIMAFSLPEYCSPFGVPGAAALYQAYKDGLRPLP